MLISSITQALRWAGIECKADIISMSFGFSDAAYDISQAIQEVELRRRNSIIFLASAGNLGPHQNEHFPARHPSVISMRTTNFMGTFSPNNPVHPRNGRSVFGTFGDNIPPRLQQYQPSVCLPGSSVATAVAAGMAAAFLSYAAILAKIYMTSIPSGKHIELEFKKLWTKDGMEKMFHRMSEDVGEGCRFLNPVKFFCDEPKPFDRFSAIYSCMREVKTL
jgi:hypothetical protein